MNRTRLHICRNHIRRSAGHRRYAGLAHTYRHPWGPWPHHCPPREPDDSGAYSPPCGAMDSGPDDFNAGTHTVDGVPIEVEIIAMDGLTALGTWDRNDFGALPADVRPDERISRNCTG